VHDNNVNFLTVNDIGIATPVEGAECEIFGWSLTTSVSISEASIASLF
jgi:hypothetical protein